MKGHKGSGQTDRNVIVFVCVRHGHGKALASSQAGPKSTEQDQ